MKKVSVIIPIYNVGLYLRQCLDSVLSQTYKNLEIICINDGSTDDSLRICQEYCDKDSRIIIINQQNSGVSRSRNNGINVSSGDLIFFLDGDDYLDSECINKLVKEYERGYSPIVGYKLDIIDKGIKEVNQCYGEYDTFIDYLKDFHKYFATKFSFVWGKLFEPNIIKENKIKFPEDIMLGEDMLFNINYYAYYPGKISVFQYNGYFYRQSGTNSLSKKFDIRMFGWNERTYNELINYLISYDMLDQTNFRHLMRNIFGNYMYSFHLISLNDGMDKKFKKQLVSQYSMTPIFRKSIPSCDCLRLDTRLFLWLINKKHFGVYIYLERVKYNISKICRSILE